MSRLARSFATLLTAGSLAAAQEPPPSEQDWDMRLVEASGEVTVFSAADPEGLPAEDGMPLEDGDRVRTGPGGAAELGLDGGGLIMLGERSDFVVVATRKSGAQFKLGLGRLLAKLNGLLAGQSLRVRTATAVAAVRGTEFGVEFEEEGGRTTVGVFDEGVVELEREKAPPLRLEPNQEAAALAAGPPPVVGPLAHFSRRAKEMKTVRKRLARLSKRWKATSPERRRELRAKLRERGQGRRERMRGRRRAPVERRQNRRRTRRPGRSP